MSEAGRERAGAPGPEHQNRFWIITQTAILAREDSPTSGMEDYICCHPDYYWLTLILSSQLLLMTRLVRMATMLGMRLHWKLIPGPGSLVRLITVGVTVSHHDGITSHLPASSLATPGCQGRDINMIRIELEMLEAKTLSTLLIFSSLLSWLSDIEINSKIVLEILIQKSNLSK